MKVSSATSHLDLADALDELHNWLNERDLLGKACDIELLNQASLRLRNFASEDPDEVGTWCDECGLHENDGHLPSCSLHPDNIEG
jgi:hypothetical protein